jgi:sugar-specific transcriptional regulator TrmB
MTKNKTAEQTGIYARLAEAGLTENDARVYIFLLERGTAFGGSKIAAALSLHRQYVHNSLEKLRTHNLIEEVPAGRRTKYKALPPSYLTHLARKRLESAEAAARELDRISAVGAEQDFEIYRGTKQVWEFEERLVEKMPEHETQYIIGGGADAFIGFFGEEYERITAVARSRGLTTRYVGCPHEEAWLKRAQAANAKFEYRILSVLPKTSVQTAIRFDSVTFYSFGNPPLVYIVKSPTVYADYKKFFDMLWNMAEQP